MPQDSKDLSNPCPKNIHLWGRAVLFYEAHESLAAKDCLEDLTQGLSTLVKRGCAVLLVTPKLERPEFGTLRSLASSVPGSMALAYSDGLLPPQARIEATCGVLVVTKDLGGHIISSSPKTLTSLEYSVYDEPMPVAELQQFKHLWLPPMSRRELFENLPSNPFAAGLANAGRAVALLHKIRVLHGDLSKQNIFGIGKSLDVIVHDYGFSAVLFRDPTSAECASDIGLLLSQLDRYEWAWFKSGYVGEFGERGQFVVNLIEHRNELRWLVYFQKGDYNGAAGEIESTLVEQQEPDGEAQAVLYSNLASCYVRMGKEDEALRAREKSLSLSQDPMLELLNLNNIGMAHLASGKLDSALSYFERIRGNARIIEKADPVHYISSLYALCKCYRAIGNRDEARRVMAELAALVEKTDLALPAEIISLREKLDMQ